MRDSDLNRFCNECGKGILFTWWTKGGKILCNDCYTDYLIKEAEEEIKNWRQSS